MMGNNLRTILCGCCGGIGGSGNEECPLCNGAGLINESERREWVAVRTLIKFDDLPIPSELEKWRGWIEAERGKHA